MMTVGTLTANGPIHWGVMLAQGWKGELATVGRARSWAVAREWAVRAEALGFDGVWAFDHFQAYPARDDSPVLEAFTTLASLAQVTERVMLGTLVSCAGYRAPAVTVKMAGNLHVLSGGRFCLGLGAGWDRPEFEYLGLRFPSAGERTDRLDEVLRLVRREAGSGWAGGRLDRRDAGSDSRAEAGPPILVGGDGEKRTLPAAVAYADAVNWQVGVREFARKSRELAELCEAAGRDPATLRRTHAPNFQLFDSEREFARWRQHEDRGMSATEVEAYIRDRGAFYGTTAAIEETIESFTDAGCRGFMVFCNAAPDTEALRQLVSLLPVKRAAGGQVEVGAASTRCRQNVEASVMPADGAG